MAVGASELLLGEDAVYMAVGFAFSAWLGIVGFGLIRRSLQIYNLLIWSLAIASVLNIIGLAIAFLLRQPDSIGYSTLSLLFMLLLMWFFRSKKFSGQFNHTL